jgi:SagB-type dehydrogenase family enzyme
MKILKTPVAALVRAPLISALFLAGAFAISAQPLDLITLPKPRTDGGRPLMQVIKDRQSIKDIRRDPLPLQTLSDMLWAAFGFNRPQIAHRTAPSAMNSQEIDIYVGTAEGIYQYDATNHALLPVAREDIRAKTGGGPFAQEAPLALIFVADLLKLAKAKPEERPRYAGIDTGFISQNVYLFCASEGLATVVHELGERPALAKAMRLRPDQQIILAQAVGYPKTPKAGEAKKE